MTRVVERRWMILLLRVVSCALYPPGTRIGCMVWLEGQTSTIEGDHLLILGMDPSCEQLYWMDLGWMVLNLNDSWKLLLVRLPGTSVVGVMLEERVD
jgi:hypothetical protein